MKDITNIRPELAEEGEFMEAASLVNRLKQCDTNGEMLGLIIKYRFDVRKRLLDQLFAANEQTATQASNAPSV